MSNDSSTEDTSTKDKAKELRNKLADAKARGPDAIQGVMSEISNSSLPQAELDKLINEAKTAMEAAIKTEKEKILAATQHEAENGSKINVKPTWDDHVKKTYEEFESAHTGLIDELNTRKPILANISNNLAAGKDISTEISKLEAELTEDKKKARENMWAKIAAAEKVTALERQWREYEKIKIEEEAKLKGFKLNDKQQPDDNNLKLEKKQLEKAWNEQDTAINKATEISTKINNLYKEQEAEARDLAEKIELAHKKGIPKAQISILQQMEDEVNKAINNRATNKLAANITLDTQTSLQESQKAPPNKPLEANQSKTTKITGPDNKGQKEPKAKPQERLVKSSNGENIQNPNKKVILDAMKIGVDLKNHAKDSSIKTQSSLPVKVKPKTINR